MADELQSSPLRRRLFRARLAATFAGRGTALALGSVLLITASAYVLGVRGVLGAQAWQAGLAAGAGFAMLRAVFGLFGGQDDPDLLREALASHFGPEVRDDHEVTRLSRQVIEQRLQLATAMAAAPADLARKASRLLPALDRRIDLIVGEARSAATRRGTARFQAGMAQLAQQRLTEVSRIAATPESSNAVTARKAADGLSAQVEATTGLVAHAEDRLMVLDHSVAEFGTLVTRTLLALSKADIAGLDALARDLGR